jgi:hypothetical protein
MRGFLVALVSVLICFSVAMAGTITPGLSELYTARTASDALPVIIMLENRASAVDDADRWHRLGLPLSDIHERLMDSLKARATQAQMPVLKSLEILESTGLAKNVRSLWLVNALTADLTRPAAELVANMNDVAEVGLDDSVALLRTIKSVPVGASRNRNVLPSLLNVPNVWAMGYHGEGRTVCVIADGAPVEIPALAARWHGKTAPLDSWFDVGGATSPAACGDAAAEMLGALCGVDASASDTLGVAPAAEWIAAGAFCMSPTSLSAVLRALQWAVDPDGNSSTLSDVPDAIINPWSLSSACVGAEPISVWELLTNAEALGPVMIFAAAANDKSGSESLRTPASLPFSFAVGNAIVTESRVDLHPSSAHGPSACDPSLIKPDVVAPGTDIISFTRQGAMRVTSGDVAAASIAGVAALLRQANPQLTAAEIRHILITTATDASGPGPDNLFGNGLVHAARAVNMALASGHTGTIAGTVSYGGEKVEGAKIVLAGAFGETVVTTNVLGAFSFDHAIADQRYRLSIGRFGFRYYVRPESLQVAEGRSVEVFITLDRGFDDDAEHDQGWSCGVEGDDAISGVWMRAFPVGSRRNGRLVQPDKDATPGGQSCFVTGNASAPNADPSENDVDNGRTTLRSPLFSLSELDDPVLHFTYWYSNDQGTNPGSDFFRVQISNDGGRTWSNLINTAASTGDWKKVTVRIADFVQPSATMLLQFIAEDEDPASLVEAAVDDISIEGKPRVPEPPRELTMDARGDRIVLTWHSSPGASVYRVYVSGDAQRIVAPENFLANTSDTTYTVMIKDIRFSEFYFQITAAK